MHARQFARVAAVAVCGSLVLAACSGGGSRLTKAELIKQADAICLEEQSKTAAIGAGLGAPTQANLQQYADAFAQALPIFKDMAGKLKALKPPEADQATWDQIMSSLDQEIAAVQKAQEAAANGDMTALNTAGQEIGTVDAKASQLAQGYGLTVCGGAGGSSGGSAPPPTP